MKKIGNCIPHKEIIESLLRKTKKACYINLDERKVSDNKIFRKTETSSLSTKFSARKNISLSKDGEIVKT